MVQNFLAKLKKSDMSIRQVKKVVMEHVGADEFDKIYDMMEKDKRTLSALIAMSYDKSSEMSWRAVHFAGRIIGKLGNTDLKEARGQVQRLIWNTSDESGTIAWTAPEILGEAIRENPEPFEDIVAIIVGLSNSETEDNIFLAGVLYALGRIGELYDEYVADYVFILVKDCLLHKDVEVCGNAILAANRLKMEDLDEFKEKLLAREEEVKLYYDDTLHTVKVGEFALKMLYNK